MTACSSMYVLLLIAGSMKLSQQIDDFLDETQLHRNGRDVPSNIRESCRGNEQKVSHRINTSDRLRQLRLRMKASGYDAYIVPSTDEHQSEYVSDHDKRREFITGFTGSAGTAVVLQKAAALWTDGRYFLQGEQELDCNWLLMKRNEDDTPEIHEWLSQMLGPNVKVGADPKLISHKLWLAFQEKLEKFQIDLMKDDNNLIDDIWNIPQGRTPESMAHLFIHDAKYAGISWLEKISDLRDELKKQNADGTIVTALDEVSWLFNLRGNDSRYTPVFKSYAFVAQDYIRLYTKPLKLNNEIRRHLRSEGCNHSLCAQLKDHHEIFEDMADLLTNTKKILISSDSSYAILSLIPESQREVLDGPSPVSSLRAVKHPIEISGMKNACLKDSTAIVDFIAMLDREVQSGKPWDEIKASRALAKFRSEQELNRGESFETISAFGPNGAVIHYKPQLATNMRIDNRSLYLLDSGGQYLDGTTDITRTFHFGTPTDFEKEAYTRVLKGSIDLFLTIFPEGVKDFDLDILARQSLYQAGLDYLHGTGHGIGNFLSVHEGPISISKHSAQKVGFALKPGMFMSNEPGFYENEKFGIRLETMMMVVNAKTTYHFNKRDFFTFEPVSFVPFEPKLIKWDLLTKQQKEWLNWFNMKTRNTVGIELRKQRRKKGLDWLLSKTEYIQVDGAGSQAVSLNLFSVQFSLLFLAATFISLFRNCSLQYL